MRSIDWCSDVCSSDLRFSSLPMAFSSVSFFAASLALKFYKRTLFEGEETSLERSTVLKRASNTLSQMKNRLMQPKLGKYTRLSTQDPDVGHLSSDEIGRASCRERVCPHV